MASKLGLGGGFLDPEDGVTGLEMLVSILVSGLA